MSIDAVLSELDRSREASLERLIDWLRIPSVSTDPAYRPEVRRAAEWCAARLAEAGLRAELRETGDPAGSGHPIVLAHANEGAPAGTPHILFYGHYDVQPADPLDLWESGPFEPVIREAAPGGPGRRVVARGACDDKGQVMTFLEALRAWHSAGGKPAGGVRLTVLIEGEEESGSANLERFLRQNEADLRRCDVCVVSDTGMLSRTLPAITYGLRGLAYTQVTLHGPDQDLHSGLWGGRVPNPISELTKILSQLWDGDRRITVDGFYDRVRPIEAGERRAWSALPFSQAEALAKIGLPPEADVGEKGYTALEREWGRPTAEPNGIWGGYIGHGAKTVIPAHASAKVSFRLVPDQDPAEIARLFFGWLERRTPPGCRWEFKDFGGGPPATVQTDSAWLHAASRAIERASARAGGPGVKPALIKSGGSIPVAGMLKSIVGLETVFMGFGLDDDRVHSPNEKFEIGCFDLGARSHAILLDELSRMSR